VLRFLGTRWTQWRARHLLPLNFTLHLIGIPLVVAGIVLLFLIPWYWGITLFVLGYLLQYLGHQAEGSEVGEWAVIKRLLGLSSRAASPRGGSPTPPGETPTTSSSP
jgi:uncharacterized membrane protein YGL010W